MAGKRHDARTEKFELIEIFDETMLSTDIRIDPNTVPEGLHMYEVRHNDEDDMEPGEIAEKIIVNFWGTLLSPNPIDLNETSMNGSKYREIGPDDWTYLDEEMTVEEFLADKT